MNTKELKRRVSFGFAGYGHKNVTIVYKGKQYTCVSTNVCATDRINSDEPETFRRGFSGTLKQAYLSLWNECKAKNNLR